MMKMIGLVLVITLAACSNDNNGGGDMGVADLGKASGDMLLLSQCGHPGDPGNSLGVGQFCRTANDCKGQAQLCSSMENGSTPSPTDTYFCTIFPCHPDDGGVDSTACGENTGCACSNGLCGCTPSSCLK